MTVHESEAVLVAAARGGDEAAFHRLTHPLARELHLHCYRMLGSFHDAEDAMQETLLRAWRHLGKFQSRSSVRSWLYRIATNVCLAAKFRDRRRQAAWEAVPGIPPWNATDVEVAPLEPYPDALLGAIPAAPPSPEARYDQEESVQLAFLSAIQLLPARQRAVLLLRDVLGWSAAESAAALETSVAGINATLQRARATLERERSAGRLTPGKRAIPDEAERALLDRFVEAWNAVDVPRLASLLTEDALLTMPPAPMAYRGPAAIGEFFATVPAGGALDRIRLVPTRANRRIALAAYLWDHESGRHEGYGIMVFACTEAGIASITGFADPTLLPHFGLPAHLDP